MALPNQQVEPLLNNVRFEDQHPKENDSRREIIDGLSERQKKLNQKFFYDDKGSQLFDKITRLPEYYPSRTEVRILQDNAREIAQYCGGNSILIEPGSGSSEKVRWLLDELRPQVYVPLDISSEFLLRSAHALGDECPWLNIHAICADFSQDWVLPKGLPEGKRVVFYPGSTIGNLEPEMALDFLLKIKGWVGSGGGVLIGVDLHKSTNILNAAYNDSEGVTAEFNLNVLSHINRVADSDFNVDKFRHEAFYDSEKRRIEMHLISCCDQVVNCNGSRVTFSEGESIHTENSYKYSLNGFSELANKAGCVVRKSWVDENELFSVHYIEPAQAT